MSRRSAQFSSKKISTSRVQMEMEGTIKFTRIGIGFLFRSKMDSWHERLQVASEPPLSYLPSPLAQRLSIYNKPHRKMVRGRRNSPSKSSRAGAKLMIIKTLLGLLQGNKRSTKTMKDNAEKVQMVARHGKKQEGKILEHVFSIQALRNIVFVSFPVVATLWSVLIFW
eukprot:c18458_g1_i1 orf=175-678(+)